MNNYSYNQILFKKFLNVNYYNKSLIRSTLLNNNKNNILDNYYNLEILQNSSLKQYTTSLINVEGASLNTKSFIYTNRLNNFITFRLNSYSKNSNNLTFLKTFNDTLAGLTEKQNQFNNFLLLNPIKGGFKGYSAGFFGFLPRSQIKMLFIEFFLKCQQFFKATKNFTFLELFKKNSNFKSKFLFRFSLYIGKVSIYPGFKKNNFLKIKKLKKRFVNNNLNIVFLVQPSYNLQ